MKKSSKIYALYGAAVLAIGSVYMYFRNDDGNVEPERGNVSIIVSEGTTVKKKTASTTTKKTKKHKTTTTKAVKTTTAKTTTAKITTVTEPTEPEILWFDINAADEEQLAKLPQIGNALAAEIIRYRDSAGGFRNIEEIMNVSGIGSAKFEAIREYIYVVDPVYDEEPSEDTAESETEHIPTLEEIAPLDLNHASPEELRLLPRIDEDIVQGIIEFREQTGGFRNTYELMYVKGVTREKAAEINPYVCVSVEQTSES